MKKIGKFFPIFFVLLLLAELSKGQKNEIGFSVGGLNYTGDISPSYNVFHYRPAGSLFYRLNFSPIVALRASGMIGGLYGNEKNSKNPVQAARGASFKSTVSEFSVMLEYNFFNYRGRKDDRRYSPYLTGGLGIFNSVSKAGNYRHGSEYIQLAIPFGVGMKYKLSRYLNLGAEFVARKTTSDQLDGVSSQYIGNHETSNLFDKDWYYYTGLSLSYTFYKVVCPDNSPFAR
jgi:Domain of unknown function (DUF6089)